ncbi:MAG: GNAT family N-acetyltransferase [Clostridiales bacterium]|nr:GNAT family N-acetyltransferase [Clostridiales bacterium]
MRYKKFEGDNLYFSPLDINDLPLFTKWVNDETLTRGLGNVSLNISELAEKDFLEKAAKDMQRYQFSVITKKDDKLLGTYDLHFVQPYNRYAEVGGFIGEISERGKGYGTEALTMICDFGFNVLNLQTLVARIYSFNIASLRSAQKVGFKQVGRITKRVFYAGNYYDEIILELHNNEFYENHKTYVKPI